MSAGVILAAAMLAQADAPPPSSPVPSYGPAESAPPKTAAANPGPERKACSPEAPDPDSDTIVVCVVKPEGYRIDPDVLAAKKAKRDADAGRPLNRSEKLADTTCSVGPHGCVDTGVNLLAVALTAAQVADRAAKGQDVGSVFKTDPQLTEYEYYQLAKAEREKKESEAADQAYAAQVEAEAAETPKN
jgi:hypothetical protein